MNLDDLLDDIDINKLDSKVPSKSTKLSSTKPNVQDEIDLDKGLQIKILSTEIKPFLAFSANVPKELREKWTKMVKVDIDCVNLTKFQPSSAYKSWDLTQSKSSTNGLAKALNEMIKVAATKSGFSDAKTAKILLLVNPVTDSENGKKLQDSFCRYIIKKLQKEIENDPNFDQERFKALHTVMNSA